VIRIHLTAADLANVRFAARPAPLQELNAALSMMAARPDGELLFGRWRRRLLHTLPPASVPLRDLVPAGLAPGFIDVIKDTLPDALDAVTAAPTHYVRSELERVYRAPGPTLGRVPGTRPPRVPAWIRELHRGNAQAWLRLRQAQQAAFTTVLEPVWPQIQDLHRDTFVRYATVAAERGVGAALTTLVPGSRLRDGV